MIHRLFHRESTPLSTSSSRSHMSSSRMVDQRLSPAWAVVFVRRQDPPNAHLLGDLDGHRGPRHNLRMARAAPRPLPQHTAPTRAPRAPALGDRDQGICTAAAAPAGRPRRDNAPITTWSGPPRYLVMNARHGARSSNGENIDSGRASPGRCPREHGTPPRAPAGLADDHAVDVGEL